MEAPKRSLKKVAFISSYEPRKCGIATFTADLINNMKRVAGEKLDPLVIAMEPGRELGYDGMVTLTIRKNVQQDYSFAADYINLSDVDIVSIQHEFGLFGGNGGSYLDLLFKRVKKPVITTLHTVLEKPSPEHFDSLTNVCSASHKVVVMNKRGIKMLHDIYRVPHNKIKLISHGIPNLPFAESISYKRKLGIEGRQTILTFGLLSENKGIEVMLKALPRIVKSHPSVLYIILGTTHPEVLRREGNSYKWKLQKMVADLHLQRNVVFHNRFVEDDELFLFLGAADAYVTPYLHKEQLTSGTLAFALGAGKAIISTPYWAAEELLSYGRGKLVNFGNPDQMARATLEILNNGSASKEMRMKAYQYGRSMIWPKVAESYLRIFESDLTRKSRPSWPKPDFPAHKIPGYSRQPVSESA
ncbi:MAG: glycosyltransferase family 4 protein [Planctomycetota bacterium]